MSECFIFTLPTYYKAIYYRAIHCLTQSISKLMNKLCVCEIIKQETKRIIIIIKWKIHLLPTIIFSVAMRTKLIVKSFSFDKLSDDDAVQTFIFKPPYKFQEFNFVRRREAANVTLHYHHLDWNDGFVEYDQAVKIIRPCLSKASEIFVKRSYPNMFIESKRNICQRVGEGDFF
uniref:Uncharacterized protein n=2 Tax=Cacopsylla melanoneura TaxID=428564 RepID=A0A8D8W4Z5_9HEMI